MQLKCSQTQKRSKDIDKTVHVTSVAQVQFCEATGILFVHKENKNNNLFNNSSPQVTVFHNFITTHNQRIISVIYIQEKARAFIQIVE